MTLDDLKQPWMAEVSAAKRLPPLGELQAQIARVRRDTRMRDLLMILPWIAVAGGVVFFNWLSRDAVSVQGRISVIAVVVAALIVSVVLLNARRVSVHDDWTLRARLEREAEMLRKQMALVLNVGYWFLLPMFLMLLITSILGQHERTGSYFPSAMAWRLHAIYGAIAIFSYWSCRREAKRRFLPLLQRVKELQNDLADGGAA